MLIENLEALKIWLTKTLSPISDADPASLGKYVVALVKKDKVDKDLKEVCIDQLEVFLQTKTKDFVDQLFDALNSKEYLKYAPDSSVKSMPVLESKSDSVLSVKSDRRKDSTDAKKPRGTSEKAREVKKDDRRHGSRSPSPRDRKRDYDDRRRRHDDRRMSDERRGYRRRSRSYSPRSPRRTRGRSRSPRDRGRSRSWSRSRSRSRPRSFSKSRSRSRSRERKVYSKQQPDSRGSTPTLDNGKYDTTSAIPTVGSAMYSVPRGEGVYSSESHPQGLPALPAPSRQRCKDYDEKGFCMRGDLCPYDHGLDPVIVEDVSIPPPPYVPGTGPPAMPANGAPRLPGPGFVQRPPPPALGPLPMPLRPDHFEPYNPEAPGMTGPPRQPFWHGPPPSQPQGAPPGSNFHRFPPPSNPSVQVRNREHLISVTVKDDNEDNAIVPPGTESSEQKFENTVTNSNNEGKAERTVIPPKRPYSSGPGQGHRGYLNPYHQNNYRPSGPKKPFDFSRIGGYRPPDTDNLSLEVRKIPKEFNNIMAINEHFSKFGNLTNIQVNFENDPEAALVTFSTNKEALSCYRSTEPLFNNRFVKVFWHKNKDKSRETSEGAGDQQQDQRSVKERLGPPIIPHPSKLSLNNTKPKTVEQPLPSVKEKTVIYTSSVGNITKTVYNPEAMKTKMGITSPTAVGSASFVSKIEAIKRQEEKKKEMMKKKSELQKQKRELLLKQLEQQKMLISKLEKTKNAEEKANIKKTIDVLSKSVETIQAELMPSKPAPLGVAKNVSTPEEARKEILDTELELFNKEHAGEDTSALKLKLSELTKQAAAMGLLGRGRGRGRAAPRPRGANTWVAAGLRGRGKPTNMPNPGSRKLDKRPKQLEVTGFDWEEREDLNQHFSKFCMVEKIDFEDEDSKSAVVTFQSRDEAEKALRHCETYKDKKLIMNWYTKAKVKPTEESNFQDEETADPEVDGHVEDDLDEEALLAGDDEEEEDEESRSWRR
uniref:RNA-binding protein 26-like isoform X1 n=1 Tax=Crassostrea virginica TaxID=6565 RepID=A0A8B8D8F1_CRAVI|nr:RNA-binding protein 26-like isoform X1 [Crassostrea virginica]